MRTFILFIIKLYQIIVSPFFATLLPCAGCKYYPSCSAYTYKSIEKYGIVSGFKIGLARILKCNPWS